MKVILKVLKGIQTGIIINTRVKTKTSAEFYSDAPFV